MKLIATVHMNGLKQVKYVYVFDFRLKVEDFWNSLAVELSFFALIL